MLVMFHCRCHPSDIVAFIVCELQPICTWHWITTQHPALLHCEATSPRIIHLMCCLELQQICVIGVCMMDDWIKDYMEICYLLLLIIFSSSYGLNKYLQFVISLYDLICTWHCTWHMHCAWIILCMAHQAHGSWVLVPFNALPRVAAYLCTWFTHQGWHIQWMTHCRCCYMTYI